MDKVLEGEYIFLRFTILLLLEWTAFCYGYFIEYPDLQPFKSKFLLFSPIFFISISTVMWLKRKRWWKSLHNYLEEHTDAVENLVKNKIGLWIALAAGLGLYTELIMIRLHSSFFQLFAFFKNISLLSCFLGLGIGYARGFTRPLITPLVIPLLTVQVIILYFLRHSNIEVFLQNPIPDQIAFGLSPMKNISEILSVYGFISFIFTFNAICFIPLGHLTSYLMTHYHKLPAYNWNLIGSLVGIIFFAVISFLNTMPPAWFFFMLIGLILFFWIEKNAFPVMTIFSIILVTLTGNSWKTHQLDVYSPYQILSLQITNSRDFPIQLKVSNTFYQNILDLSPTSIIHKPFLMEISQYYALPYIYKPNPANVLIVGSGTGNDVASALRHGANNIDAVEIDPLIYQFGKDLHPENPYQAKNVNVIINDARSVIRSTHTKYDLIVYGLLDSHSSLFGNSNVRLDNYVYTQEAFQEARNKLKDDGVICMAVSLGKGKAVNKFVKKLLLMLKSTFNGRNPLIYKTNYDEGYTFIIGNHLEEGDYRDIIPFNEISNEILQNNDTVDISTDDWPFLYMPIRKYPFSYIFLIGILLIISYFFIRNLIGISKNNFSFPSFFLGAGFMLLETKAITELGLNFGNTLLVVSVTIFFILVMAYGANFIVLRRGAPIPLLTYSLLCISLIVGMKLTTIDLTAYGLWLNKICMPIILTLPIFFSGFAFSTELKNRFSVPVAMSSNLLGAMMGGFLEYNTMYFGFHFLYLVALMMYFLAFGSSVLKKI